MEQSASFFLRIHRHRNSLHQRLRPRATLPRGICISQTRNARPMARKPVCRVRTGRWRTVDGRRGCRSLWKANGHVPITRAAHATADRRSLAAQAAGDHEARAIAAREPAALSRADGDRLRQDAPRHRLELPLAQVRRRQARALSGRPGQPGQDRRSRSFSSTSRPTTTSNSARSTSSSA